MKKVRQLALRVPSPGFARHLGSWQEAVQTIAEAEGCQSLRFYIGQMYDFWEEVRWSACVVCWRAWYSLDFNYSIEQ